MRFMRRWGTIRSIRWRGVRFRSTRSWRRWSFHATTPSLRYRASFLYASGDDRPRSGTSTGFDSIVDAEAFAGGEFSFFNRESIRLTGTGVALTPGDSFLPDLRSSKDEGQSNFNNPGLYLYNAGADAKLTQSLKVVGNVNFLQFARTQPLIFILQQNGIRRTIGTDASVGAVYRPLLSDNIILSGGAAVLVPGRGLRDFLYVANIVLRVCDHSFPVLT